MVDDYGNSLAEQGADDAHLVAGAEGHFGEAVVGDVLETEVAGIVHEADVDAAGVGGVVVYNLKVPVADLGLAHDVLHYGAVLDFGNADYGGAVRGCLGGEVGDGVCEVVDFLAVFPAVPLPGAVGSELDVAPFGIVWNRVEEVLEVIKSYTGDLDTSLRRLGKKSRREAHGRGKSDEEAFHSGFQGILGVRYLVCANIRRIFIFRNNNLQKSPNIARKILTFAEGAVKARPPE